MEPTLYGRTGAPFRKMDGRSGPTNRSTVFDRKPTGRQEPLLDALDAVVLIVACGLSVALVVAVSVLGWAGGSP